MVSSFLCANGRSYDDRGGENQRFNGKKRHFDSPIKVCVPPPEIPDPLRICPPR